MEGHNPNQQPNSSSMNPNTTATNMPAYPPQPYSMNYAPYPAPNTAAGTYHCVQPYPMAYAQYPYQQPAQYAPYPQAPPPPYPPYQYQQASPYPIQNPYPPPQQQRRQQNPRNRNTTPAIAQPRVKCEVCNVDFKDKTAYEAHASHHVTCPYPDCEYMSSRTLMLKHTVVEHEKIVPNLDTDDAVIKWREERRQNFPTPENIAKKEADVAARRARGEIIQNNPRFESMRVWGGEGDESKKDNGKGKGKGKGKGQHKKGVCRFFKKGKCRHGDKCKYVHEKGGGDGLDLDQGQGQGQELSVAKLKREREGEGGGEGGDGDETTQHREEKKAKVAVSSPQQNTHVSKNNKQSHKPRVSLLRRLLDDEIRSERSVILQCFRRLVQTDFAIAK